jgi:hypothetical protein
MELNLYIITNLMKFKVMVFSLYLNSTIIYLLVILIMYCKYISLYLGAINLFNLCFLKYLIFKFIKNIRK